MGLRSEVTKMGWEILLGAALEAALGLLAEAGFGDEVRDLEERLLKQPQRVRGEAFARAFDAAVGTAGTERIRPLLEYPRLREAVIAGLMDPERGFDLQAAVEGWEERLPPIYVPALRRFFNALESALLADQIWGPVLEQYQELRFREDVRAALRERQVDVPVGDLVARMDAALVGAGAIAQGEGARAVGARGVLVEGDMIGDVIRMVVQNLVIERVEIARFQPGPQPDALRVAYLKRLTRECGALRLLGLDTGAGHAGADQAGDVHLEAVYVHLDTTRSLEDETDATKRARLRSGVDQLVVSGDREVLPKEMEQRQMLTALEAVARFPCLVLIGGPGAGKSTFANYLTLCLAAHDLPAGECPFTLDPQEHLPGWSHDLWPLPMRVTLREFARELSPDVHQGTADLLWQHIERRLAPLDEFKSALKEALLSGRALVVLDGLDEVPETRGDEKVSPRKLVLQAVEDFALRAFPDARYLVTCRVASYVSPWTLPKFEVAPLAEFDEEKRDHFCQLWYLELAQRGQLDEGKVEGKVAGLQRAIRRPDLARMAGTPLLLTVMALVHAREPELPEARALLYEKCVDVLLWLWERRKEDESRPADLLSLLQEAGVDRTFFVRALDRLAYDVHTEGGAQEGEADIRTSVLERRLEVLHPQRDPRWARRVATFIRERAGLLVEQWADVVDPVLAFPHRTFQEYLAACWLTEGEDTACKAAELARQGDHWWEVIKLAAGRLLYVERKVAQPLAILDWLCPEGEPTDEAGWRLVWLAGEVLLELKPEQMLRDVAARPQLEGRLERVRHCLAALLESGHLDPRERAEAGNVLAQLGDPRFRADAWYLPNEPLLGFVEVPQGPFLMGTRKKDVPALSKRLGGGQDWYKDEVPQHPVTLPAYYVARYPVTVGQFRAFVNESGYKPADEDSLQGVDNHPVVNVTWYDALAYCQWLTGRLREWEGTPEPLARLLQEEDWEITLPSEAQWEKVARGGEEIPNSQSDIRSPQSTIRNPNPGRVFPWGDEVDAKWANYDKTGIGTTSAMGCFPGGASPYGVEDLSGNVWEWTRSLYRDYPYDPEDGREDLEAGRDVVRVLRGGAFFSGVWGVRCAARYGGDPVFWPGARGFRLVASPVHL